MPGALVVGHKVVAQCAVGVTLQPTGLNALGPRQQRECAVVLRRALQHAQALRLLLTLPAEANDARAQVLESLKDVLKAKVPGGAKG